MTSANENLPAGMGGLKYPVSQVSLVVNDLHRTMEAYYEAFGWTGWRVFDHVEPTHHGTQLRGKPVPYSLRGAEVMVGDLNFELLEPTRGPEPVAGVPRGARRGHRLDRGHVRHARGVGGRQGGFAKLGIDVTMRALIGDHIEYYYLDTQDRFGCLIESGSGHAIDFVSAAEIYPPEDGPAPAGAAPAQPDHPGIARRPRPRREDARLARGVRLGPVEDLQSDGKVVMHDCTLDGKPVDYFNIRWAEVMVGDLNFELIEPIGGDNPWQRMLDTRGEGIGSIAVMFKTNEESEAVKREFAQAGMGVTASGRIGDHIEWYYLDTQPAFKCVIESGSGHAIDFMTPEAVYP